MSSPRLVLLAGHGAAVEAVAFSPDSKTLATCGEDRLVLLWDVSTGTLRAHLEGHREGVRHAAFSPDGALLATADRYAQVRLWDARSGKWLGVFLIRWKVGEELLPAEAFQAEFHRLERVAETLR